MKNIMKIKKIILNGRQTQNYLQFWRKIEFCTHRNINSDIQARKRGQSNLKKTFCTKK